MNNFVYLRYGIFITLMSKLCFINKKIKHTLSKILNDE